MNLVLDITTSMEFWRQIYPANRAPAQPCPDLPDACACTMEDIDKLRPEWMTEEFLKPLDGVVHVMAFDKASRRKTQRHAVHAWSGPIPSGSFYKLKDGVFVASLGFAFLVAASLLDKTQLVAFGCELCGLYGFDERQKRGFRKRATPLLTIEKLGQYLAGAEDCRGYRKAMAALPHIVERSASPSETFDVLAFTLPCRLGGYALYRPFMNYKVTLTPRAALIAKRDTCYPDMCYLDPKLDIEHHGKLDHSDPADKASDRARVNALKEMGFEVIELTWDQVSDLQAFEYIVQRIARLLGKRLRNEHLGPTEARLSFRESMKAWNQSSGRLR